MQNSATFAAQPGAQNSQGGLVLGGFFTLYNFAVVSPLVPAAEIIQIGAVAPVDRPVIDSPHAQPLNEELEAVVVPVDMAGVTLVQVALPVPPVGLPIIRPADEIDIPLRVISGPIRPGTSPVFPAVNGIPEPTTLSLAALAAVALVALSGNFFRRQPRSSRRRILPTGLLGKSSRNSTILGRL